MVSMVLIVDNGVDGVNDVGVDGVDCIHGVDGDHDHTHTLQGGAGLEPE